MNRLGDLIEKFFNSLIGGMYATFASAFIVIPIFLIFGWDTPVMFYIPIGLGIVFALILFLFGDTDGIQRTVNRIDSENQERARKENEMFANWALKDYHRSKGRRV